MDNAAAFIDGGDCPLGWVIDCDPNHPSSHAPIAHRDGECPVSPGSTAARSSVDVTQASPTQMITPPDSFDDPGYHTHPGQAQAQAQAPLSIMDPLPPGTLGRSAPRKARPPRTRSSRSKKTTASRGARRDDHPAATAITDTGGGVTPPVETQDKQSSRRRRNREAAQKCRAKKNSGIKQLEADAAAAEAANAVLQEEVRGFKQEVLMLKSMILEHAACDCDFIDAHIQNSASSLLMGNGHHAFTALDAHSPAEDPIFYPVEPLNAIG